MASQPVAQARKGARVGVRGVALALVVGVLLGLLSFTSDYLLRYPWSMVGNTAGTWVLAGFAVGALTGHGSVLRAALAGLGALAIATVVYYASMALVWPSESVPKLLPGVIVWGAASLIVGPAAGAAGGTWTRGLGQGGDRWWLRSVAVGLVAAVLAAEAVFRWGGAAYPDDYAVAGVELAVAALIPLALLRPVRERVTSLTTVVLVGGAAVPLLGLLIPIVFKLAGSGRL